MKWQIPAKTFLLGEYVALTEGPSLVITTSLCFELTFSSKPGLQGIHPDSPAGRWWADQAVPDIGLQWHDPYQGRGGMGASSAQFIGIYLACLHAQKKSPNRQAMLEAYFQYAWFGQGLRPSGYDVLAQSMSGCVYINRQQGRCQSYDWPFHDLAFVLLHTGKKLATHHHLQTMTLSKPLDELAAIAESAATAFESADSHRLVDMVNAYHQQLTDLSLIAEHSREYISLFKKQVDVLAAKGCGAMGADVLLLLVQKDKLGSIINYINNCSTASCEVLATSENLWPRALCSD